MNAIIANVTHEAIWFSIELLYKSCSW